MSGIQDVPAERFPHGTRSRYVKGCRCKLCRRANTIYANSRSRALTLGRARPGDLVEVQEARLHMLKLSRAGVGRRAIGQAAGVSDSILSLVRSGVKRKIRRSTAEKILAVTEEARSMGALISSGRTLRQLRQMEKLGLTKTEIARRLGSEAKQPSLQISGPFVIRATAEIVERVLAEVRAERKAQKVCGSCGFSHDASRLEQLKGLEPADVADLPRTWPCLYGGPAGAARLAADLATLASA